MSFKTIPDLDCTVSTAIGGVDKKTGKKNPTTIEGYYIGTRQVASALAKTGFAALHILQTAKGNVGVWGKTNLDQKMTGVTPGVMTRITFTGTVKTKYSPMYKYEVAVDSSNSIEVAALQPSAPAEEAGDDETPTSEEYGSYEDISLDDEEPALDETPPARAAAPKHPAVAPDAARQAKVRELLNRANKKLTA